MYGIQIQIKTFKNFAVLLGASIALSACVNWNVVGPASSAPAVMSFSPSTGTIGTLITLAGRDFTSLQSVTIGTVPAIILNQSNTSAQILVMPGTAYDRLTVVSSDGVESTSQFFTPTANPYIANQQGPKLTGNDSVGAAQQGFGGVAVSADGKTAIVVGPSDNSLVGAAWVYTQTAGVWSQQGPKLVGTGYVGNSLTPVKSGVALSADGNTAAVARMTDNSGVGAVWIYTRTAGIWTQQGTKLVGTGNTGASQQGNSIALSADGNTLLVGGQKDNAFLGAAWVFTRTAGVWTQQGVKLVGTGAVGIANQGWSVALSADGNTAIMGGYHDNSLAGAAWVFTRTAGVWSQQGAKLVGTGTIGLSEQGTGIALSADGNTAVVGGINDNGVGAVWVYTRSAGIWTQQTKLTANDSIGASSVGCSVTISADGNTIAAGGNADNTGIGAVWTFTRSNGAWIQSGTKLVGTGGIGTSGQGKAVAISSNANTLIVGGQSDNTNIGAAWIFTP